MPIAKEAQVLTIVSKTPFITPFLVNNHVLTPLCLKLRLKIEKGKKIFFYKAL